MRVPFAMRTFVLLVDGDGAGERAVHRVARQQAGALDEVVVGSAAHDDRAQPQPVPVAGVADQDAGEEATDAAEPVQHDIGSFRLRCRVA